MRNPDLRKKVVAASRAAFTRLVDLALSERVAALLIAGDLFDGKQRSAGTGAFLVRELDRLRQAEIRVFYIKGNHDAENPISGALELPPNVHVFDARGGKVELCEDVWIHGVSFADRHAPDSLLPRFKAPAPGAVNIALMHSSLGGSEGHDTYAPCHISDLVEMGFDYWALGHVHKRKVHARSPWVVMPGIPQGRDIGESGPKSATLLEIGKGEIDIAEVPTSVVEFAHSTLDVTAAETDDMLRSMLREHIGALRRDIAAPTGVVRLRLTGQPARHWQFLRDRDVWAEQVSDIARGVGDIWIDKMLFDLSPLGDATGASSAVEELAGTMAAIRLEPGFATLAKAQIETVLQDLPAGLRDRIMPDEAARDALIDRLAETGAQRVLAQLKAADS